MRAATCTWTLSISAIEKPGFFRRDEVDARPDGGELVVPVGRRRSRTAETPVAVLVSVTLASGTAAPGASFTVPTTEAVSNCADARGIPRASTTEQDEQTDTTRKDSHICLQED